MRQPQFVKIVACSLRALFAFYVAQAFCASANCAEQHLQYNRDVRPILLDNCFSCHGPDEAQRLFDGLQSRWRPLAEY